MDTPWGPKESETTEQLTLSHFDYADSQSVDMLFAGCLFLSNFLLPCSSKSMLNPVSVLVSEGTMPSINFSISHTELKLPICFPSRY